jgi:oligopeptide transport system substrate-binding protein
VKNASDVHSAKKPAEELGIRASSADRLTFEFSEPDPDFLYKLTASLLVPLKSLQFPAKEQISLQLFNGPYRAVRWNSGRRMALEPNPHFVNNVGPGGNPQKQAQRPSVEVLFLDEDQTALNLYEKGELTFLRRLPTHYIPTYKNRPDFHQIPVARFDYIGFGEALKDQPNLRAALSYSANFTELQKIYDALGPPGCHSLPDDFVDPKSLNDCVKFDLEKAKTYFSKVPAEQKAQRLRYVFSKAGGEDLKKGAEWFQSQWKKHLNLTVDLEQTETGVFFQQLRVSPPPIFRKGVGLERPTCLSALETFAKGGSENFFKLDDPAFEKILARLASQTATASTGLQRKPTLAARKTCSEGIRYLLDHHLLIPLGKIHWTLLVQPRFKGWHLNQMNQLDLSQLTVH